MAGSCNNAIRSCIERFGTLAVIDAMISEFRWIRTIHKIRPLTGGWLNARRDRTRRDELTYAAADSMTKNLESVRDEWSSLAVTLETLNAKEMK